MRLIKNKDGKVLVSKDGSPYKSYNGIIPKGTLTIDSNGTHNVKEYEFVDINVGGVAVFEPKTNNEIEVILPAIPITEKRYLNSFIGNAEIVSE
jgi:hypothetical protein